MAIFLPLKDPNLVDLTPIISAFNLQAPPSLISYENLNAKPWVREKMIAYIYYKLMDDWLYEDEMDSITNSLLDKYGKDKKSKIKYIEEYIFNMSDMKEVLTKLTNKTGINWFDLHKKEGLIKELMIKYLGPIVKKVK